MHKISILYSWFVRSITYFLPNIPFLMRFRGFMYSLMMKNCGKNFQVASTVVINSLSGLQIGHHVYIANNTILIGHDITIKDEVIIGPNCVISSGNHAFDGNSFRFKPSISGKVLIEQGSWVAGNCTLTAGSTLPVKSILAAGAVLNKTQKESNSIYGGIPAKFIRHL